MELAKSVRIYPAKSARKVRHPAPFPVELPCRLIQLYTFEGEVILDPFIGSGQTVIAAIKTKRYYYIGYDIDEKYAKLAKKIKEFLIEFSSPKTFNFSKKVVHSE